LTEFEREQIAAIAEMEALQVLEARDA